MSAAIHRITTERSGRTQITGLLLLYGNIRRCLPEPGFSATASGRFAADPGNVEVTVLAQIDHPGERRAGQNGVWVAQVAGSGDDAVAAQQGPCMGDHHGVIANVGDPGFRVDGASGFMGVVIVGSPEPTSMNWLIP